MEELIQQLEYAYEGAGMMDDIEAQTQIARALAAIKSDPHEEIFTEEFKEKYYNKT